MKEYDVYLPMTHNGGESAEPEEIARIKAQLTEAFGGYTHFQHRIDGVWKMGGVTFHDEITIVRVLDEGRAPFDWPGFKQSLEARLRQDTVLIVARDVKVVG